MPQYRVVHKPFLRTMATVMPVAIDAITNTQQAPVVIREARRYEVGEVLEPTAAELAAFPERFEALPEP